MQKGGYMVYVGEVGEHAKAMVDFIQKIPGTTRCPRDVNPATWCGLFRALLMRARARRDSSVRMWKERMPRRREQEAYPSLRSRAASFFRRLLDVLAGVSKQTRWGSVVREIEEANPALLAPRDDPGGAGGTGGASADADGDGGGAAAAARRRKRFAAASPVDGRLLQAHLIASEHWAELSRCIDAHAEAGACGMPPLPVFDSAYARGSLFQLRVLLVRLHRCYVRDPTYNFGRIVALCVTMLIFGIIYLGVRRLIHLHVCCCFCLAGRPAAWHCHLGESAGTAAEAVGNLSAQRAPVRMTRLRLCVFLMLVRIPPATYVITGWGGGDGSR